MKDTARLVPVKKGRSPLKLFLLMGIVALVTAIALKKARLSRPKGFVVRAHAVEAGAGSFTVTWRSKRPYKSALMLLTPERRVIKGEDRKATKKHKVVVGELAPNELYSYAILYPNKKTSLSQTVRTLPLQLRLIKCDKHPKKGHTLYFETKPQSQSRMAHGLVGGQQEPLTIAPCADGIYALTINKEYDRLTLELSLAGSSPSTFSIKSLLSGEVIRLTKELKSFNRKEVMAPTEREMTKAIEETFKDVTGTANVLNASEEEQQAERAKHDVKLRGIRNRLEEHLAKLPYWPAYLRTCALSPILLDSGFLSLNEQLLVHERVRPFQDVDLYMAVRHIRLNIPRPHWGLFKLERTPPKQRGLDIQIYKNFKKPLLLGNKVPFSETVLSMKEFSKVLKKCPKGPALVCLTVRSFLRQSLRVTVNGRVDFTLCDRPVYARKREMFTFFQYLPQGVIKEGENKIRIRCDVSVGRVATRGIAILRLALHFPQARAN